MRLDVDKDDYLLYLLTEGIGSKLSEKNALQIIQRMADQRYISQKTAYLMKSAVTDKAIAIPSTLKDGIRSSILKSMITAVMAFDEKNV